MPNQNIDQTIQYVDNLEEIALEYFNEVASNSPPDRFGTEGGKQMQRHIKQLADALRTNIRQS